MLQSTVRLGTAQIARTISLPQQVAAPVPAREALLEGVRHRNALLDYLFYDIKVVHPEEAARIAPRWAAEGAILLVPPSGVGRFELCPSIDAFKAAGGAEVSTLAVAGVGSSALGSAAFARNIADAIGRPVAAVVSGYGLADLLTEALGGFFWFGTLNQIRHLFEGFDRVTRPSTVKEPPIAPTDSGFLARQSRDTRTVLALLEDEGLTFDLLAGHSKGNLVVSEALYGLRQRNPSRVEALAGTALIVTFSARIAMPLPFKRVIDVMGSWDWFGGLNSRPGIPADKLVPDAWHHTNTELYAHLPVTRSLRQILP